MNMRHRPFFTHCFAWKSKLLLQLSAVFHETPYGTVDLQSIIFTTILLLKTIQFWMLKTKMLSNLSSQNGVLIHPCVPNKGYINTSYLEAHFAIFRVFFSQIHQHNLMGLVRDPRFHGLILFPLTSGFKWMFSLITILVLNRISSPQPELN